MSTIIFKERTKMYRITFLRTFSWNFLLITLLNNVVIGWINEWWNASNFLTIGFWTILQFFSPYYILLVKFTYFFNSPTMLFIFTFDKFNLGFLLSYIINALYPKLLKFQSKNNVIDCLSIYINNFWIFFSTKIGMP